MQSRIFLLVLTFIMVTSLLPVQAVFARPQVQYSAFDLIAEVNALRISNGLPAYSVNSILMSTAQAQADYMAATGNVTHSGPGGISYPNRLLAAGYPLGGDLSLGGFRSENIISGQGMTAAQAIQAWTGDAPHLNTMLSTNLTEIGAGVAVVNGRYYYVIDCARPTNSGAPQPYTPAPGSTGLPAAGTPGVSEFMIPVSVNSPDGDGNVYHEVQNGQSLWSIAIAYGVKIDDIRRLNNLSADLPIYPGDRLLVRIDPLPMPTIVFPTLVPSSVPPLQTPTLPAAVTATSTAAPISSSPDASGTGIVMGIVLLALLVAGLLTWMSARRPA